MHSYLHHINDFKAATEHLSRVEKMLYLELLWLYYAKGPIQKNLEWVCWRIGFNESSTAVQRLLNEYFYETPTHWQHERCDLEISKYQANNSQKALAGKASAEAKRLKKERLINGESTPVETPLLPVATDGNKPITLNHKPIKTPSEKKSLASFSQWSDQNPDPDYSAVYEYAESINLPEHFFNVAFFDFEEKFRGVDAGKKYKCWTLVFLRYLRENWLKVWYKSELGEYVLTTKGLQCEAQMLSRDRAKAAILASAVQS